MLSSPIRQNSNIMKDVAFKNRKSIESIILRNADIAFENEKPILSECSYEFPMGRIVWITGPSGVGKSTLLRTIAGLLPVQKGEFLINGEDVSQMSFEEFLPYRLNIGYSFDIGGLLSNRTMRENLELPLHYHNFLSRDEIKQHVENILNLFHITKYQNLRPFNVPGTVRKAICLARAFILSPQILLLDDPIAGLTEEGVEALEYLIVEWNLLKDASKPLIVMTGRDSAFIRRWADVELKISDNPEQIGLKATPLQRNSSGVA